MFLPDYIIFILAFIFYLSAIIIHILTIKKIIPFTSINGGRSKSYEEQAKQSYLSIAVLLTGILFVLIGMILPNTRNTIIYLVIAIVFTLFWALGTIVQLLGTKFEKYVVFWINLIGFIAHLELVLSYFDA